MSKLTVNKKFVRKPIHKCDTCVYRIEECVGKPTFVFGLESVSVLKCDCYRAKVAAVSAAQAEARVHNYTKMVVCAARSNLAIQTRRDVRLSVKNRADLLLARRIIEQVLKDWDK